MNRKQVIFTAISETLIPILGLLYFEWSLYFIALFYLFDIVGNELIFHLKAKKIFQFNNKKANIKKNWFIKTTQHLILFSIIIFGVGILAKSINPDTQLWQGFLTFLKYEEEFLPIPQGFIILPLVFLSNFQLYKLEFLTKALYRTKSISEISKNRIISLLFAITLVFSILGASFLFHLPDYIWLLTVVILKFLHDVFKEEIYLKFR